MNLHEYLLSDGALTVAQLREAIGVKSDAQIRQWQHGYADRKPNPEYCVAIERATGGKVTVEVLNPMGRWVRVKDKNWPHPQGRPLLDPASQAPADKPPLAAPAPAERGIASTPRRPKENAQRDGPTPEPKDAKYDPTKPRSATNNPGDRAGDKGGS